MREPEISRKGTLNIALAFPYRDSGVWGQGRPLSFQFTTDKERGSTPREGQQGECVCVAKANNTLTC